MQKFETDKLYIIGLFMVTNNNPYDPIVSSRFLKWIVVENESDDYSTSFRDIKTKVMYFSYGFEIGDLFIDMDTIISMDTFTHKEKISKEEIDAYLKMHKEQDKLEQIRDKRIILETIKKSIKALGPEKSMEIITEVIRDYDEEVPKNIKEFVSEVSTSLELKDSSNKNKSKRYKRKGK